MTINDKTHSASKVCRKLSGSVNRAHENMLNLVGLTCSGGNNHLAASFASTRGLCFEECYVAFCTSTCFSFHCERNLARLVSNARSCWRFLL